MNSNSCSIHKSMFPVGDCPIQIGKLTVGPGYPVVFIAEAGVNHDGSLEKAKKLIDVAVEAKADIVKFQTFKTDKLLVQNLDKCAYQKVGDGGGSYADMIRRLELNEQMHIELMAYCKQKGIMFLSTPFDEESVDMLDELGVEAFKIDSGNLNNPYLVRHIASKQKPIVLSTGMARIGEIDEALQTIYSTGNHRIILLHCTSNYPPAISDVNLLAMNTIKMQFNTIVGYSDHTPGIPVSLAAVALGACVIEKHFTLDRSAKGPDHLASVEPHELKELIAGIRMISTALGSTQKHPVPAEKAVAQSLRRSVVSLVPIKKGTVITKEMVAIKRPGDGIAPKFFDLIVGRVAQKDIAGDTPLSWDQI